MSEAPSPDSQVGTAPRSLADWLRTWNDEQLERLISIRPDLVLPVPQDTSVLALRAGERLHVARALDQLDAYTLSVVDRILLTPLPRTAATICAGDPRATLAVASLRDMALVWGTTEINPVSGLSTVIERPAGLGRPLAAMLRYVDRTVIASVLDAHGLPRSGDADEIAQRLLRALPAAVPLLDPAERQVLDRVDRGGSIGTVADALVPALIDDPSPVRRLLARGLFLPLDADTVEIPREVGIALRGTTLFPEVPADPPPLTGPTTRRTDADSEAALVAVNAVRLVSELLAAWSEQPSVELKAGGVAQRDLRAAARMLAVDESVATLLIETARAAGLVGRTTSLDASFAPTAAYDAWLRLGTSSRWAALAEAWLDSPIAPALLGRRIEGERAPSALSGGGYHRAIRELRRQVLGMLRDAQPDLAPDRESVLRRLAWVAPRLVREETSTLVDDLLTEAAQVGMVGGGLVARYAAPLLDHDATAAATALVTTLPKPIDYVLLQADLTAVAPGLLDTALADDLALLSDVESPGGATVYRFSDRTIRRALDIGWDAGSILRLLERIGRPTVPQTLRYLVEDTARRHGQLRIGGAGAYIRCDDEALLTEVVADRRTAALRLRHIAPTVAVSPLGIATLLEQLRGAGYAPVGERPDGTVNLARPEGTRAARGIPTPTGERAPDERTIRRMVAGMRAGDRARSTQIASPLREKGISASLDLLDRAITEGRPILLGYVNAQGRESRRVVDPERVSNGLLTAYDHQTQERRSFALSRITELGLADDSGV